MGAELTDEQAGRGGPVFQGPGQRAKLTPQRQGGMPGSGARPPDHGL